MSLLKEGMLLRRNKLDSTPGALYFVLTILSLQLDFRHLLDTVGDHLLCSSDELDEN